MPIYEYECRSCGHQLEAFQKISEEPLKKCPHCGKDDLSKLISATSFQLKGTGWYVTDIRDKDKPKPKENEATSGEQKPAAKEGDSSTTEDKSKNKSESKTTDHQEKPSGKESKSKSKTAAKTTSTQSTTE